MWFADHHTQFDLMIVRPPKSVKTPVAKNAFGWAFISLFYIILF